MTENFKFRYVRDGNVTGFLASKGSVDDSGLRLGELVLPLAQVADTTTRDERLVITLDPHAGDIPLPLREKLQNGFLVLHIYGMSAVRLEKAIDRRTSAIEAAQRKAQLVAEGKGHLFRTETCPCCAATVDLSELPEADYSYCRFCETVFGKVMPRGKASNTYCQCDECGYYDRVQGYGEFYFYFLLVVYGFRHRRRHLCDDCGASLANKLLAMNAIFLLGVPNALACAIRARAGRDQHLSALASANALAKKGKMREAEAQYAKVLQSVPGHPGAHFNMAIGNLKTNDSAEGLRHLQLAIESCPSFEPALRLAHRLSG